MENIDYCSWTNKTCKLPVSGIYFNFFCSFSSYIFNIIQNWYFLWQSVVPGRYFDMLCVAISDELLFFVCDLLKFQGPSEGYQIPKQFVFFSSLITIQPKEAFIEEVESGICPSLEYATDKSC